ncbi:hypothetical protein [Paenibacillus tyrfis]|uniref:hypothetical protein n=1 Tax=Paenibacillus tyrfis TaxID=1501230 RepID=UPI0020A01FDE|nr:hypothetical protein [Paenibacillus tyrfis]MCP1310888.1 hypothetical protein [Paenibacillus tyrfis]
MIIFAAVIAMVCLSLKDLPRLLSSGLKKEIAMYSLLTVSILVLGTLVLLEVKFMTPQKIINEAMENIVKLVAAVF